MIILPDILHKLPHFNEVIDKLPERFFLQEEFPLSKSKEEAAKTGALLDDLNFDPMLLTGSQLEDLIFCLIHRPSYAVESALSERVSNRILGLIWAYFQYNYDNDNILRVLSYVAKRYTRYQFEADKGQLIFIKGFLTNCLQTPVSLALSGEQNIKEIISKYGVIEKSPYWYDMLTYLFVQSPANILKENFDLLAQYFKAGSIPETPMIRYLDVLSSESFSQEVNLILVEKLGLPDKTDFWQSYPDFIIKKLTDWYKIYNLSVILKPDSKKYKLLSEYSHAIKDVIYDEENSILKILFGEFNIIDDLSSENICIFCSNPSQSLKIKSLKQLDIKYSAKDFIVQSLEKEYMYLYFNGLDKMYAKEMLDILLKISEDDRNMR